jgi:integrase/recombinase XerD
MLDVETFKLRASSVYREKTLRRKISSINQYGRFIAEKRLKPGLESLSIWLDELRRKGKSPNTISAYGRDVLTYFEFMMMDLDEKKLKILKKTLPPIRFEKPEYLTEDEVSKLINSTGNIRRKLIYLLCYTYARRLGEVLALTRKDIDLKKGTITFPILKKRTRETATYELEETVKNLLSEYLKKVKGEKIFNVTDRAVEIGFKMDCRRAGIKPNGRRLRVHILRHSRVTNLRDRGVPIDLISTVLARHSNISTTVSFYMGITEKMKSSIPKAEETLKIKI